MPDREYEHTRSRAVDGAAGLSDSRVRRDRELLMWACVEVADVLSSQALRAQLITALAQAGVSAIEVPAGTPFDPVRHKATGAVTTSDAALDHLVVDTEKPGFVDRGRQLRPPEVTVYSCDRQGADGAIS
jgi:molecular chaperone GrpE